MHPSLPTARLQPVDVPPPSLNVFFHLLKWLTELVLVPADDNLEFSDRLPVLLPNELVFISLWSIPQARGFS